MQYITILWDYTLSYFSLGLYVTLLFAGIIHWLTFRWDYTLPYFSLGLYSTIILTMIILHILLCLLFEYGKIFLGRLRSGLCSISQVHNI